LILENYKTVKSLQEVLNQLKSYVAQTSNEEAKISGEKALNEGRGVGTSGVKKE
jgi:hypothetical protein